MSERYFEGIGRRKESTARVRISNGSGKFIVNEKEIEAYFTRHGDTNTILEPLVKSNPEMQPPLRKGGYLTRNPLVKERKKPGLKGARKAPTYTKR